MAALINFSGIASGIDSSSLIKAILDQQRSARIKPLKTKVTELEDTNGALSKLSSLLDKLSSAASKFRALNGSALAKQASSSDETKLTATASSSASNGVYNLNVISTARNATFSFDDRFASADTAIKSTINNGAPAADRTVSITTGTGAEAETVSVVLTNTTTAQSYVDQYNSQATKSVASLVNLGTKSSPSYAITINSLSEGTEQGTIADPVVGAELAPSAFQAFSRSQASDAVFTVSGISGSITRSSNTVGDVIEGVSFNLLSAGSATVTVSAGKQATITNVQDFIDAYNALIKFVKDNDLVTRDGEGEDVANVFGPLASTSLDESLISALRGALRSSGISGFSVNTLADLGIATQRDGTLSFDTDAFSAALDSDSEAVRTITANLGETLASVDGTIAQFNRFNGLIDQSEQSNSRQIGDLNGRITEIEKFLAQQEQALIAQFSRLEGLLGRLNSQQSTLQQLL